VRVVKLTMASVVESTERALSEVEQGSAQGLLDNRNGRPGPPARPTRGRAASLGAQAYNLNRSWYLQLTCRLSAPAAALAAAIPSFTEQLEVWQCYYGTQAKIVRSPGSSGNFM
jgi:hypothetical protein